jgi:hypothetical protein
MYTINGKPKLDHSMLSRKNCRHRCVLSINIDSFNFIEYRLYSEDGLHWFKPRSTSL